MKKTNLEQTGGHDLDDNTLNSGENTSSENKTISNSEENTLKDNENTLKDNESISNSDETISDSDIKQSKKMQFLQFLKFLAFSLSAGVIQIVSFGILYEWTGWLEWWPSHLISVTLSVIWNFTFNRKFTFKSASNVPLAMALVIVYYACYIPASVFGGNALEAIGWDGFLVEALMMIINFITEFFWDKYVVFNDKLLNKVFKLKKSNAELNQVEQAVESSQDTASQEIAEVLQTKEVANEENTEK